MTELLATIQKRLQTCATIEDDDIYIAEALENYPAALRALETAVGVLEFYEKRLPNSKMATAALSSIKEDLSPSPVQEKK